MKVLYWHALTPTGALSPLEAYDKVVLTTHRVPLYWTKSPPLSPADLHSAHSRTWSWLLLPTWGTCGFTSSGTYGFFRPLTVLFSPYIQVCFSRGSICCEKPGKKNDLRGICVCITVKTCQDSARVLHKYNSTFYSSYSYSSLVLCSV